MAYGRGGTEPTVTDAALALGMLGDGLLAGGLRLDADGARRPSSRLADRLALAVDEVAPRDRDGGLRGHGRRDPRDHRRARARPARRRRSSAFGGAGPAVRRRCWRTSSSSTVVVIPPLAGNFSAWGLLGAPRRREASQTLAGPLDAATLARRAARRPTGCSCGLGAGPGRGRALGRPSTSATAARSRPSACRCPRGCGSTTPGARGAGRRVPRGLPAAVPARVRRRPRAHRGARRGRAPDAGPPAPDPAPASRRPRAPAAARSRTPRSPGSSSTSSQRAALSPGEPSSPARRSSSSRRPPPTRRRLLGPRARRRRALDRAREAGEHARHGRPGDRRGGAPRPGLGRRADEAGAHPHLVLPGDLRDPGLRGRPLRPAGPPAGPGAVATRCSWARWASASRARSPPWPTRGSPRATSS